MKKLFLIPTILLFLFSCGTESSTKNEITKAREIWQDTSETQKTRNLAYTKYKKLLQEELNVPANY